MATELKSFVSFFGILIFVFCVSFVAEARPLRSTILQKLQSQAGDDSLNGLSFLAVKVGQSTPGGLVHKYTINAKTIKEINNSGPSPRGNGHKFDEMNESGPSPRGNGHKLNEINNSGSASSKGHGRAYVDAKVLGEIKDSGPSPGNNHGYTNTNTLGGIKDSGTSSSVDHKYVNVEAFEGRKDAGPSPGNNNVYTNFETLEGIKDSGPAPGDGHHKYTNVET